VPDFVIRGTAIYRILSDQLGSPRIVVDITTGEVVQRMRHDEFGNVVEDTNPGFTPFGFAGGMYDSETALVRFGARDYEPQIGRWLMKDPVRWQGRQSNLFVYVGNDPVNGTDPRGTWYTAACKAAIWAGCRQGCSGGTSWGAKAVCSTLCNAAGKYMFCEWHDSGEPEPQQPDGGMCAAPEPEPEPGRPCDPTVSSCGP
jgi:RHS repeat-associated protein